MGAGDCRRIISNSRITGTIQIWWVSSLIFISCDWEWFGWTRRTCGAWFLGCTCWISSWFFLLCLGAGFCNGICIRGRVWTWLRGFWRRILRGFLIWYWGAGGIGRFLGTSWITSRSRWTRLWFFIACLGGICIGICILRFFRICLGIILRSRGFVSRFLIWSGSLCTRVRIPRSLRSLLRSIFSWVWCGALSRLGGACGLRLVRSFLLWLRWIAWRWWGSWGSSSCWRTYEIYILNTSNLHLKSWMWKLLGLFWEFNYQIAFPFSTGYYFHTKI